MAEGYWSFRVLGGSRGPRQEGKYRTKKEAEFARKTYRRVNLRKGERLGSVTHFQPMARRWGFG